MALLGFVGFLSMSSQRMCINVAMVCMLNHTALSPLDQPHHPSELHHHHSEQQNPTGVEASDGAALNSSNPDDFNMTAADTNDTAWLPMAVGQAEALVDSVVAAAKPTKSCAGIPDIYVLNPSQFHYQHVSL